jgi:hypothetical protein
LELSRTRYPDEETKDDAKDDDNEDPGDNHDTELEDYQNASLTFQERSLREYFKAVSVEAHGDEELRTPAGAAHLTIFTMCAEILMSSAIAVAEKKESETSWLRSYAIKYWYEHFNELDAEAATDEQIILVLSSLHCIVNNTNNVAKSFERFAESSDIYPERDDDAPAPWYDRVQAWCIKGTSLAGQSLSSDIKTWAAEVAGSPKDVLLPLARGHVQDWLTESIEWYITEAHNFAVASLKLVSDM